MDEDRLPELAGSQVRCQRLFVPRRLRRVENFRNGAIRLAEKRQTTSQGGQQCIWQRPARRQTRTVPLAPPPKRRRRRSIAVPISSRVEPPLAMLAPGLESPRAAHRWRRARPPARGRRLQSVRSWPTVGRSASPATAGRARRPGGTSRRRRRSTGRSGPARSSTSRPRRATRRSTKTHSVVECLRPQASRPASTCRAGRSTSQAAAIRQPRAVSHQRLDTSCRAQSRNGSQAVKQSAQRRQVRVVGRWPARVGRRRAWAGESVVARRVRASRVHLAGRRPGPTGRAPQLAPRSHADRPVALPIHSAASARDDGAMAASEAGRHARRPRRAAARQLRVTRKPPPPVRRSTRFRRLRR